MTALESRMVLHSFMCNQFGYSNLREMLNRFKDLSDQSDESDYSAFSQVLKFYRQSNAPVSKEKVTEYDENIAIYSQRLEMTAEQGKTWKPFQYLALLFTERYLDLYFSDPEKLLVQLNEWQQDKWPKKNRKAKIPHYDDNDLRTLAFQSATGSGKTLLLHANILQYKHYLKAHKKLNKLNKIILVTPDEGLSRQHRAELHRNNIPAQLFSDDQREIFSRDGAMVDIIDLHKLGDKKGIKRVALESFEENNLVLVDEGHLGVGGTKWRSHRKTLAKNGFTFEYSATFNQAVAGTSKEVKELRDEYGKSILFDYSYKFFYEDGYGKDYQISNLQDTADTEANDTYLLACLLMFYQQCKIYEEKGIQWRDFNIASPLWVFLGRTVTGGSEKDKEMETDVIRIVKFLAWVQSSGADVERDIATLLSGNTGLIDKNGADIFKDSFPYINDTTPNAIYNEICRTVFHAPGQLYVSYLSGSDELQLSAGDSTPYGVINVGDAPGLFKKLQAVDNKTFVATKNAFAKSLFANVDNDNSPINIVIGARKFAAGWNSWRVSTMGLMHVGSGEGPQIIQMFGRGVRLKGHGMSLKRHNALTLDTPPKNSEQLKFLETLNIFGLKANYMDKFKEYLSKESVGERTVYTLSTKKQLPEAAELKILKRDQSVGEFPHSGERIKLVPPSPAEEKPITLDLRKHVQSIGVDEDHADEQVEVGESILTEKHVELLDRQAIYHKILERKFRFKWHNMEISQEMVNKLINTSNWYSLYISPEKLEPLRYSRVREWEDIFVDLISEYAKQRWRNERRAWEHEHLDAVPLEDDNSNYVEEYTLSVSSNETALLEEIEAMIERIEGGDYSAGLNSSGAQISIFSENFHAYIPLLQATNNDILKITPLPLNDDEMKFVNYLKNILENKDDYDFLCEKEVYLMRNSSRGKGVYFFNDVSFYPDFILWIKDTSRQHILFIDPKGLVHYNQKVQLKVDLHKTIKETEQKIKKKNPNIYLHSYIWSHTSPENIGTDKPMTRDECHEKGIYISSSPNELCKLLENALTTT